MLLWRLFDGRQFMNRISVREAVGLGDFTSVIDVREDDEYDAVHVVESVSIPLGRFVEQRQN